MRMRNILAGTLAVIGIALSALTLVPPPRQASAQFFAQQGWAGTSGGTANAQTLVVPNMDVLVKGVPITFIPVATNTAPTTININAIGNTSLQRPSSIGLTGLSGSELASGVPTTIMWDGTNLSIVSPVNPAPVASIVELRGAVAPPGYLIEDGSCVSQTTYAALFSVIATSYGSCSAGLFALPDSRGTMFAALDNQGVNGSANRITSAGSGCTATAIGLCGLQSHTLSLAEIPTGISSANGSQTITVFPSGNNLLNTAASSSGTTQTGVTAASGAANVPTVNSASWNNVTSYSGGNAISVTSTNTSGSAHAVLNPILLGRRAIKY